MWSSYIGRLIMTLLISMVPVVELRGAIPMAVAHDVPLWLAILVACVGNLIPVPFIIIFIRKVFAWVRRRLPKLDGFVERLERRAAKKSDLVQQFSFWGLVILVAIPLPGTGAWTGALIAAMLEMRLKRSFPAITLGVFIAGLLVGLASHGVINIIFA